jgi:RNA polymerase sigma factor (sigma-70 family)
MTDSEIRIKLKKSPDEGYRALFETYFNYVYSITFHILRNCATHEDIEECVADVFLEVIQHYDTSHDGSVKAYVGTVAKRKAIDMSRSVTSRKSHVIPIEDEQMAEIPSAFSVRDTVETTERNRILIECILSLGEPDSSIILQKYFYDRNSIQIAKMLHLSPPAVRMRCNRAMKRLRKLLSEKGITL